MKGSGATPILLVDVDGVLSLFGLGGAPPAGLVGTAIDGLVPVLAPCGAAHPDRLAATRHRRKPGAIASSAGPDAPLAWIDVIQPASRARRR